MESSEVDSRRGSSGGHYIPERTRNVFVNSPTGGRVLSAAMLPWFAALPPDGWGIITTTGRRTGKARRKCVRAIRRGGKVYIVSLGHRTAWLGNLRADPHVRLRLRGGTFTGIAREPSDRYERDAAWVAYRRIRRFDYIAHLQHRRGRPTHDTVLELLRTWFTRGVPVIVEIAGAGADMGRS